MAANLEDFPLKEVLIGDLNRLRYIKRFSSALCLHQENVAEHSFYVALYAYLIALWVEYSPGSPPHVMPAFCAVKALLHDTEECRTGDFPRPFKYSSPHLREAIEKASENALIETYTKVANGHIASVLATQAINAKDNTFEGRIVKLADFMSVISHLWQEVNCSNNSMKEHYASVFSYCEEFESSDYDFVRPIVDKLRAVVYGLMESFKETLSCEQLPTT